MCVGLFWAFGCENLVLAGVLVKRVNSSNAMLLGDGVKILVDTDPEEANSCRSCCCFRKRKDSHNPRSMDKKKVERHESLSKKGRG